MTEMSDAMNAEKMIENALCKSGASSASLERALILTRTGGSTRTPPAGVHRLLDDGSGA